MNKDSDLPRKIGRHGSSIASTYSSDTGIHFVSTRVTNTRTNPLADTLLANPTHQMIGLWYKLALVKFFSRIRLT